MLLNLLLGALLLAAAVNFILYAARHELVRVIDEEQDFTVRYPRVYLWVCVVFFLLVATLVLFMIVWQDAAWFNVTLTCVLGGVGVPFLLLSVVWKIRVKPDYIVYVSPIGVKKQIYYKDIKKAVLTKRVLYMETTLKAYRFSPAVVYRENFLRRLRLHDIPVERY